MPDQALQLKDPPGPKGHKLLGIIPDLRARDVRILNKYGEKYGDVVRFKIGPHTLYFLNHPDYVRRVLQSNYQNYSKDTRAWNMLRAILGSSVFITSGDIWKKRRRLMQPLFNPPAIVPLFPMMNRIIGELIDDFSKKQTKGLPVDMRGEMLRVTLRIIGETIMGADVAKHVDDVGRSLTILLEYIVETYSSLINVPLFIPTQRNINYRKALKTLNDIVFHVIGQRRKNIQRPDDLLTRLMEAKDEDGKLLTDSDIRDEIMTMFLAGHETTASSLTWTWILLAQNPEIDERLYRELVTQIKSQPSSREELAGLQYTHQVMDETLRLYPPVYLISRCAEGEDQMGEYRIPPKSTVFFSPYIIQRSPRYWRDPEKFDPERFNPENKAHIQPYTYVPFIEGPRKCLGYHFALIESPLVISAIARNFRPQLKPGENIEPHFGVTLRPKAGILMQLEKR